MPDIKKTRVKMSLGI